MKKMSYGLLVCGSRGIYDYRLFSEAIKQVIPNIVLDKTSQTIKLTILTGDARGVDSMGNKFAVEHGFDLVKFPADWDRFGKSAGYRRNYWMFNYLTTYFDEFGVFAMWDGRSPGTNHAINEALQRNVPYRVFNITTNKFM